MRRIFALLAATSMVVMLGGAAQAVTADLKLIKITTSAATAQAGDRVVFRAYARNRGPGPSQLDVTYSDAVDVDIKREVCVVPPSESGDIITPTADTPSCEFSDVPARDFVIVRIVAVVTGTAGGQAELTFCTSNETGLADPNPDNDCQTAGISITA
ncbi:MAG: hypothetical protein ABI869_01535 [Actinomycetota bacterium]